MTTHDLKVWPPYLDALLDGSKPFEVRNNDRAFEVGDLLDLREWDPTTADYTGRAVQKRVTYVLPGGQFGLSPRWAVLGLAPSAPTGEGTNTP